MNSPASDNITVKYANLKSKCWVVRPGARYRFIAPFLDDSFIAMGHLDNELIEQDTLDLLKEAQGETIYSICESLETSLTINSRAQVISFVNEMKAGDVVFTLSKDHIYPGIISSDAFISLSALSPDESFQVRRRVAWGDRIERDKIPVTLAKSFNAYQAVFSLGENSKEIHHWLSSFFISEQTYFSSLRVNQEGSLSHHSLKNLSELMDRLQVLSVAIGQSETGHIETDISQGLTLNQILSFMSEFDKQGLLLLTSQQVITSPGNLWYGFKTHSTRAGIAFLLGVAILFSQGIAFADPALNKVCDEVRPLVEKSISAVKQDVDLKSVQRNLWVGVSKQNKSFVEKETIKPDDFPTDGDPRYSTR